MPASTPIDIAIAMRGVVRPGLARQAVENRAAAHPHARLAVVPSVKPPRTVRRYVRMTESGGTQERTWTAIFTRTCRRLRRAPTAESRFARPVATSTGRARVAVSAAKVEASDRDAHSRFRVKCRPGPLRQAFAHRRAVADDRRSRGIARARLARVSAVAARVDLAARSQAIAATSPPSASGARVQRRHLRILARCSRCSRKCRSSVSRRGCSCRCSCRSSWSPASTTASRRGTATTSAFQS